MCHDRPQFLREISQTPCTQALTDRVSRALFPEAEPTNVDSRMVTARNNGRSCCRSIRQKLDRVGTTRYVVTDLQHHIGEFQISYVFDRASTVPPLVKFGS